MEPDTFGTLWEEIDRTSAGVSNTLNVNLEVCPKDCLAAIVLSIINLFSSMDGFVCG
jgi:hypothetical protein